MKYEMSNNGDYYYRTMPEERPEDDREPRADEIKLEAVKPGTYNYSYSNSASQGALIDETEGFPRFVNKNKFEIHSAYSDRLQMWDHKRMEKVCEMIGGGDQVWAYKVPGKDLRKIAQVAFNLKSEPEHVRFIHYFNVATGYSCPVILAICKKEKA